MFVLFYQAVRDAIAKEGAQPLLDEAFSATFCLNVLPPDSRRLWENYLRRLLNDEGITAEFILPGFWSQVVSALEQLTQYTTLDQIQQLLEMSVLKFLHPPQKREIIEKIQNFQLHLPNWYSGAYHQRFLHPGPEQVMILKDALRFNSLWETARFLWDCGYPFPHSQFARQAWKRFSHSAEAPDYQTWWDLLAGLGGDMLERLRLEYQLESFFSGARLLFFKGFRCCSAHCPRCPLTDDCEFYRIHYNRGGVSHLKHRIESGNVREIATNELLHFLLTAPPQAPEPEVDLVAMYERIHPNNLGEWDFPQGKLSLLAIKELGRREQQHRLSREQPAFTGSTGVFRYFEAILKDEQQESFFILLLDNKNRVLTEKLITRGILDQSLVHPREVFASAIQARAASIILIHNHPSGVPTPSRQDIQITRRLCEVGRLVGIEVLDHVIIGDGCHYSFVDQDIMPGSS